MFISIDSPVGFIGFGKVANLLASNMKLQGFEISAFTNRTPENYQILEEALEAKFVLTGQEVQNACEVIFITTNDDNIEDVCNSIEWSPDKYVIHCSGNLPLSVLSHAQEQGCITGALHPFKSIVNGDTTQIQGTIDNTVFGTTTDNSQLSDYLDLITSKLNSHSYQISDELKTPYHIAAVSACGHLTTLLHIATTVFKHSGASTEQALQCLKPLILETVNNYFEYGSAISLTGPAARNDKDTVLDHVNWLYQTIPEYLDVYTSLTKQGLGITSTDSAEHIKKET